MILSGPVAVDKEGLGQPQEILWKRRENRKRIATPLGTWPVGARTGSLWLCCARLLAGKRKSEITGSQCRPMPTPWERKSWESYEEEEPVTEEKKEYNDLTSDLGEKER